MKEVYRRIDMVEKELSETRRNVSLGEYASRLKALATRRDKILSVVFAILFFVTFVSWIPSVILMAIWGSNMWLWLWFGLNIVLIANWNLVMVFIIKSHLPLWVKVTAFNLLKGETAYDDI